METRPPEVVARVARTIGCHAHEIEESVATPLRRLIELRARVIKNKKRYHGFGVKELNTMIAQLTKVSPN